MIMSFIHDWNFIRGFIWQVCDSKVSLATGLLLKSFHCTWHREIPYPFAKSFNFWCKTEISKWSAWWFVDNFTSLKSGFMILPSRVSGIIWDVKTKKAPEYGSHLIYFFSHFCFLFRLMEKCKCRFGYQDVSRTLGGKESFLCNLEGLERPLLTSWVFLMKY